jgi:hypothetical protein
VTGDTAPVAAINPIVLPIVLAHCLSLALTKGVQKRTPARAST